MAQHDCAQRTGERDIVVEIVETDAANSTLPVVSPLSIQEALIRIRGKNMLKGIEKMVKIHNELLELEAQIDKELLEAAHMQQPS